VKKIAFSLKQFFWLIFLLLLPSQLGKHFWPAGSFFWGLKIDYLSPTIYLTDIFLILLLAIQIAFGGLPRFKIRCRKIFCGLGIIFIGLNIFFAANQLLAFYGWGKFLELLALVWLVKRNQKLVKTWINRIIFIWFVLELALVLGQFLNQASLGGFFWWLGERTFSLATPGIAKFDFFGQVLLRPYGTFSHPNSLAGFVLGAIFVDLIFGQNLKLKIVNLILGFLLLIFSFSRGVIFVGLLLMIFYLKETKFINRFLDQFLILFWLVSFGLFLKTFWQEESFFFRWLLFLAASKMFVLHPFFGVGLKNFILLLPDYWPQDKINYLLFQPVHNIYLLLLAEIGIGGVGLFIFFLKRRGPRIILPPKMLFPLLVVLLTGLFDHYWLTLEQNFLFLGIILGLLNNNSKPKIFGKI